MNARTKSRLGIAYGVIAVLMAATLFMSARPKLAQTVEVVKVVHDTLGLPMDWIPVFAACDIAGGIGLVAGIWQPRLGIAAALGLVLYTAAVVVLHLRVGAVDTMSALLVPLLLSGAAFGLRISSKPDGT